MRAIKNIRIFNALLGCLVSSCVWANGNIHQDLSQPIVVRSFDPIVKVRLQANPTTGYQWVLIKYDSRLMEKPTSVFEPPRTDLVGAPGYAVWRFKFKPVAFKISQKTTVVLEYKRPWEKIPGTPQNIQIITKK